MKFLVGSRKHAVTIRFSMIVQVGQAAAAQSATIESEPTYPWVVITNECQWEEAEGLLIRKEAFSESVRGIFGATHQMANICVPVCIGLWRLCLYAALC